MRLIFMFFLLVTFNVMATEKNDDFKALYLQQIALSILDFPYPVCTSSHTCIWFEHLLANSLTEKDTIKTIEDFLPQTLANFKSKETSYFYKAKYDRKLKFYSILSQEGLPAAIAFTYNNQIKASNGRIYHPYSEALFNLPHFTAITFEEIAHEINALKIPESALQEDFVVIKYKLANNINLTHQEYFSLFQGMKSRIFLKLHYNYPALFKKTHIMKISQAIDHYLTNTDTNLYGQGLVHTENLIGFLNMVAIFGSDQQIKQTIEKFKYQINLYDEYQKTDLILFLYKANGDLSHIDETTFHCSGLMILYPNDGFFSIKRKCQQQIFKRYERFTKHLPNNIDYSNIEAFHYNENPIFNSIMNSHSINTLTKYFKANKFKAIFKHYENSLNYLLRTKKYDKLKELCLVLANERNDATDKVSKYSLGQLSLKCFNRITSHGH